MPYIQDYSVRHKGICIVTFAIIEDSLPARFILLELGEYFLELLLIFQLLAVKTIEPLEICALATRNRRMATNARIINMFACIAVSLLRRPESMDTPCSVKTYGRYRSPPLVFEMPFWHFKDLTSSLVRLRYRFRKIKIR